eukprot:scaffold4850_cov213-Pinguiococcus_pyrenoidosus.AAC.12
MELILPRAKRPKLAAFGSVRGQEDEVLLQVNQVSVVHLPLVVVELSFGTADDPLPDKGCGSVGSRDSGCVVAFLLELREACADRPWISQAGGSGGRLRSCVAFGVASILPGARRDDVHADGLSYAGPQHAPRAPGLSLRSRCDLKPQGVAVVKGPEGCQVVQIEDSKEMDVRRVVVLLVHGDNLAVLSHAQEGLAADMLHGGLQQSHVETVVHARLAAMLPTLAEPIVLFCVRRLARLAQDLLRGLLGARLGRTISWSDRPCLYPDFCPCLYPHRSPCPSHDRQRPAGTDQAYPAAGTWKGPFLLAQEPPPTRPMRLLQRSLRPDRVQKKTPWGLLQPGHPAASRERRGSVRDPPQRLQPGPARPPSKGVGRSPPASSALVTG